MTGIATINLVRVLCSQRSLQEGSLQVLKTPCLPPYSLGGVPSLPPNSKHPQPGKNKHGPNTWALLYVEHLLIEVGEGISRLNPLPLFYHSQLSRRLMGALMELFRRRPLKPPGSSCSTSSLPVASSSSGPESSKATALSRSKINRSPQYSMVYCSCSI